MAIETNQLPPKRRMATLLRFLVERIRGTRLLTWPALAPAHLPPMNAEVEIVRDARGVAHIYARTEADLYAALGYLMGADRFTLMDLLRHLGAGRLTELIGNPRFPRTSLVFPGRSLLDVDAFVRPLDFEAASERDYERAPERARRVLEAFAGGVNAALKAMNGIYPIDHLPFGPVLPWRPADALLIARTCAFCVALAPLDIELVLDAVRGANGDDLARAVFPEAPWDDAPECVPGVIPEPEPPLHLEGTGSNNWAVAGSRSASGKPVVANDPHVPFFPLPTFWYHAHLECPQYRIQGGLLPGCPVFPFGHNGFLAWGVTTAYRDAWDLFRIHRAPDDPSKYRTASGWGSLKKHRERHTVRFGSDAMIEWESCPHGIVYPGWKHHDGVDLALRYVPSDAGAFVHGFLRLAEARTVAQHRAALEEINLGPFDFNHVYGHVDGTIAWEPYGQLVARARSGLFVRDAHDPTSDWRGMLPFSENPKIINPASGFVATANSFTDETQSHLISSRAHVEPLYRQRRIETFLAGNDRHSIESFFALQSDIDSDYGTVLRDAICTALERRYAQHDGVRGAAFRALRSWNGRFDTGAVAPSILAWLQRELADICFLSLLGPQAGRHFLRTRRAIPRVHRLLVDANDPLREPVEKAARHQLPELVARAFERAIERLEKVFGPNVSEWTWGRVQRIRLALWLGELPWIGRYFRALDDSFPGELYTVSPSVAFPFGNTLRAFVGATSRFVCDLAKPEEAYFAHSSGPSGNPNSRYFDSCTTDWRRFDYFKSALWQPHEIPDVVERVIVPAA
ncbi:MAG: penicillin acylase family protein [Candidatus Binatia bacterium]|nr:penicillin acylase family protein [Candidatus Binatia bacterium]